MSQHPIDKPVAPAAEARAYRRHVSHSFEYRQKRRRSRAIPLLLFGAGLLAVILGVRLWDYQQARQEYNSYLPEPEPMAQGELSSEETAEEIEVPAPTPTQPPTVSAAASAAPEPTPQPFYSEQVRKLQRDNKDTVAYLDVPGTTVQYPVVQGTDNVYYMNHTFAKKRRSAGAIFLDSWNEKGFTDFNTVVYGHNMKDGSMFAPLREYRHTNFLRDHKYIEITLLNSKHVYKVFAAYQVDSNFDFRGYGSHTREERSAYLRRIMNRSEVNTNAEATVDDSILTLVTCTSENRDWYWVVHAVLTEEITEQKE